MKQLERLAHQAAKWGAKVAARPDREHGWRRLQRQGSRPCYDLVELVEGAPQVAVPVLLEATAEAGGQGLAVVRC